MFISLRASWLFNRGAIAPRKLHGPAPHKDWALLNSPRKAKGSTAGLGPPRSAAAGHPHGYDAQDARRRAHAASAPAGRAPGAIDLALRRATTRAGRRRRSQSCRRSHIAAPGADVGECRMPRSIKRRRFPPPGSSMSTRSLSSSATLPGRRWGISISRTNPVGAKRLSAYRQLRS